MPLTPSFRAAGVWSFTANNVATPFTCTPGAPTGKAVGDLLILFCESRSNVATVATPSGWTLVTGFPKRSGTALGGTFYVFTRIADGTATDTPSPVWSGLVNTGTTGDASGAGILAYINATATLDGTVASSDLSAQTTTSVIPAFTTANYAALVIGMAMKLAELSGETSTVATFTESSDNNTTSGTGHCLETSHLITTTPGSSGTATVTWSNTTSARALAVTLGLQAAPTTTTDAATISGVTTPSAAEEHDVYDAATIASVTAPSGTDTYTAAIVTSVYRTRLTSLFAPLQNTPSTLLVRARKVNTTDSGVLSVSIFEASTLREGPYSIRLNDQFGLDMHSFSMSTFSTYSDIEVEFKGIADPGGALTVQVSSVKLEIPKTTASGPFVYTDAATLSSVTSLSAVEIAQYVEAATLAAKTAVSFVEVTPPDAATISSVTSLTSTDVAADVEAATISSKTTPSATDVAADIESATIASVTSVSFVEVTPSDAATIASVTTVSALEEHDIFDAATLATKTSLTYTEVAAYVDQATLAGVTTPSSADVAAYVDASTVNGVTTPSALDVAATLEAATIASVTTPSATDIAAYVEAATLTSITSVSALEEHDTYDAATITSITTVSGVDLVAHLYTDAATITNITIVYATAPASDNFNRANGALGSNWVEWGTSGQPTIVSNSVQGSSAAPDVGAAWIADTFTSDQFSQAQVSGALGTGEWLGVVVRANGDGSSLYNLIYFNNGGSYELRLYWKNAGSYNLLSTFSLPGALSAGDTIRIEVSGSSLTGLVNSVSKLTASESTLVRGAPGIAFFDAGESLDNWLGGALGVEIAQYVEANTPTSLTTPSGTDVVAELEAATISSKTTPTAIETAQYEDETYRVALNDTFTRTIALGSGMGSPEFGPVGISYTYPNGGSAKFGVNGTQGQVAVDVANSVRMFFVDSGAVDQEVLIEFTMPTQDTAQTQQFYLAGRGTDLNNFYALRMSQTILNGGALALAKRVAGVQNDSLVVFNISNGTLVPGSQYWLKLAIIGSKLFGKYWLDGSTEPNWLIQITDTDLTTGSNVGFRAFSPTGSTVLPTILVDNLSTKQVNVLEFIGTVTSVSALEEHDIPDSATIASKSSLISADILAAVDQATISGVTSLSATDISQIVESGTCSSVTTPLYTETAQYVELATIAGVTTVSGSDIYTPAVSNIDSATIPSVTSLTYTEIAAYVESATLSSKTSLTYTDVISDVESATCASKTTPSTTDTAQYVESATVSGTTTVSGVDIGPAGVDAATISGTTSLTPVELYAGVDAANLTSKTSLTFLEVGQGVDSNTCSFTTSVLPADIAAYRETSTVPGKTTVFSSEIYIPAVSYLDTATITSVTTIFSIDLHSAVAQHFLIGTMTNRWPTSGVYKRYGTTSTYWRWISTDFIINRLVGTARSAWRI